MSITEPATRDFSGCRHPPTRWGMLQQIKSSPVTEIDACTSVIRELGYYQLFLPVLRLEHNLFNFSPKTGGAKILQKRDFTAVFLSTLRITLC